MDFQMIGPGIVLGLGCIGSSIGCAIAGMASHAAMSRVEEGHAKFIALSAVPSSQAIFGFILMMLMRGSLVAGTLAPLSGVGIALFAGSSIMASAIFQGKCAATAIQASAKQPALFGKAFIVLGVIESFALFTFVFSLFLIY